MASILRILVFGLCLVASAAGSAAPMRSIAALGFSLDNTSPVPSTPEELARTQRLGAAFSAALQHSGLYRVVDITPAAAALNQTGPIRQCNGCETAIATKLGADLAAYGWVQKVSNLILNLNVVIEDAHSGKMVSGGSVDIRGNTDESWDRGLKFLMEEHVLPR